MAECEKCGGKLIEGRLLTDRGLFFYPRGEEKKAFAKRSEIVCECCSVCGHIQNLKAGNPEKLS